MATKPALKLEPTYRSGLEKNIAAQLEEEGVSFEYEKLKLEYDVPARKAKYTPDFKVGTIVIESKGAFGYGPNRFSGGDPVKERQKLILVKAQHPDIDLRIVFQRAATKIRKGSPTSYAMWAEANGFLWADKGTIPPEWIEEMKAQCPST
jgi:Phage endonuclease I